jgi:hypothetical protein
MIIFLDYDGVLHPSSVYMQDGRPTLRGEGELFMWAPALIEALEPHAHIKIVLSTNWARRIGFVRARDALPESLRKRVIGATWHSHMALSGGLYSAGCWYDDATRYQQIARYVVRAQVSDWLAIDDLHEHTERWNEGLEERLIHTWPMSGLGDEETLALLKTKLAEI